MSNASGSSSAESLSNRQEQQQDSSGRAVPIATSLVVLAAISVLGFAFLRQAQENAGLRASEDRLLRWHGMTQPAVKRLATEYTDHRGSLLADPPTDASQLLDPETLVLAHYIDSEVDAQLVDWQRLQAKLAEATGKQIVAQEYHNSADDIALVKSGAAHIVALHAADTPNLVNTAGYIPVANLGTESGPFGNCMVIATKIDSSIRSLADIRSHKLTCTRPDSITGYRAAIAYLVQEIGIRPDVDYSISWSYSQSESISQLAQGQIEVAAISDDKLRELLKEERVKPTEYREIYRSEVIPKLTIGHIHQLRPELAAQVTAALLAFENETGPADETTRGKPLRFYPVDYKKDFQFVRRIDDSFDPRFHRNRPPR